MASISTSNLTQLPGVLKLRDLLQSLAMLDAILSPDWDGRYYSFNAHWSKGEQVGSMRNGQGDEFFALFNSYGCFFKGFVHDSPAAAARIPFNRHYQGVPAELSSAVTEPAFSPEDVTFCLWRSVQDTKWSRSPVPLPSGDDPDGSLYLLGPLDGNPETYRVWAEDYYECEVPLEAVQAIFERQRLTNDLLADLGSDLTLSDLRADRREIGYP